MNRCQWYDHVWSWSPNITRKTHFQREPVDRVAGRLYLGFETEGQREAKTWLKLPGNMGWWLNVFEVSKTNFVFSLVHHFWFRLLLDTVLRWIFSWLQWLCCRRVLRNRLFSARMVALKLVLLPDQISYASRQGIRQLTQIAFILGSGGLSII